MNLYTVTASREAKGIDHNLAIMAIAAFTPNHAQTLALTYLSNLGDGWTIERVAEMKVTGVCHAEYPKHRPPAYPSGRWNN